MEDMMEVVDGNIVEERVKGADNMVPRRVSKGNDFFDVVVNDRIDGIGSAVVATKILVLENAVLSAKSEDGGVIFGSLHETGASAGHVQEGRNRIRRGGKVDELDISGV
jgi:hypothetical protein